MASIGLVAALYPGVWGVAQIWTGHWSDRAGRKPLITAGMLLQAAALGLLAGSDGNASGLWVARDLPAPRLAPRSDSPRPARSPA